MAGTHFWKLPSSFMKLQMSCLPINIWNNEIALLLNCPLLHLHTNNKVFFTSALVYPPLFHPSSSSSLSSPSLLHSPTLWNDLCCDNYWVISTLITLNICSVTMLKAFGCALEHLFYVLTVLWCRQTLSPYPLPSLYMLSALLRWFLFFFF